MHLALTTRHPRALTTLAASLVLLTSFGCTALGRRDGDPLVPTRYQVTAGPYRVLTNAPLAPTDPAIVGLTGLERQLTRDLGLRFAPNAQPIDIYILNDQRAVEHVHKIYDPGLPHRRAFFLAQDSRRVIYTYRSPRLVEDLRHEATHALLHAAVADLPLWLDEGLAEYYESPEDRQGINAEHLARLPTDRQAGWTPELSRLESLVDVRQMSPRDYREAWLWVHYLLNGDRAGRAALLAYLADLRTGRDAGLLSTRLAEANNAEALLTHEALTRGRLASLPSVARATSPLLVDATEARPILRYQDESPMGEPRPTPNARPRRSILGRFLGLFGF